MLCFNDLLFMQQFIWVNQIVATSYNYECMYFNYYFNYFTNIFS